MNTHKNLLLFLSVFQFFNLMAEEIMPILAISAHATPAVTYESSFDPLMGDGNIKAIDSTTGLMIGSITYTACAERKSINTLHVEPSYRQHGIATQLINRALHHIAQIPTATTEVNFTASPFGIACMKLDTLIKFYQKRGAILIHNHGSWAAMKFVPQTA